MQDHFDEAPPRFSGTKRAAQSPRRTISSSVTRTHVHNTVPVFAHRQVRRADGCFGQVHNAQCQRNSFPFTQPLTPPSGQRPRQFYRQPGESTLPVLRPIFTSASSRDRLFACFRQENNGFVYIYWPNPGQSSSKQHTILADQRQSKCQI